MFQHHRQCKQGRQGEDLDVVDMNKVDGSKKLVYKKVNTEDLHQITQEALNQTRKTLVVRC